MQVRCKKGSTKLVAGQIYEVRRLTNDSTNKRKSISIDGFGNYSPKNFTMPDGSILPTINWNKPYVANTQARLDPAKIAVGDILVCMSDRYVHLMKGGKYKVSDVRKKEMKNSYNNSTYYKYSIKFDGYGRYLEPNGWSFRALAVDESRDLNLTSMFMPEGEEIDLKINTKIRKIDVAENKNKILVEALAKAICDRNRHKLDVIDWTCSQSSKVLKITREDFKELLDMPLSEILKLIDTNKK